MDRRSFLGCSLTRLLPPPSLRGASHVGTGPSDTIQREIKQSPSFHAVKRVARVDMLYVHFGLRDAGGIYLDFENDDTAPEDNVRFSIPRSYPHPGFHVTGDVLYVVSVWPERLGNTGSTFTFTSTVSITVYVHIDRGKEIVLVACPVGDGGQSVRGLPP
jgi:hypothetical protein